MIAKIVIELKSMDNGSQVILIANKTGQPAGQATKLASHQGNGIPHLGFLIILFDKHGLLYLAQRASKKTLWPGYWDGTIASHILPHETPQQAASRRAKEELNLTIKPSFSGIFYYFTRYNTAFAENEFCSVFVAQTKQKLQLNPQEISQIKTVAVQDFLLDLERKQNYFTPWLKIAQAKFPHLFTESCY